MSATVRLSVRAAVLIASLALMALPATAKEAGAHAALERASPDSQAKLALPPGRVDLWFTEPLEPAFSSFMVYGSDGVPILPEELSVDSADPRHLSGILPQLAPGIYTVGYRTLSTVDGHEWTGTYTFVVLDANGAAPGDPAFVPSLSGGGTGANATGRWFLFAGLSILLGGAGVGALLPARLRASHGRVEGLLAIASAPILLCGLLLQLLSQRDSLDASVASVITDSRVGLYWALRSLFVVAALVWVTAAYVAFSRGERALQTRLRLLASASVAGAFWTIAALGHAAAAPGSGWAVGSDFVHLLASGIWVGGLVQLAALAFVTHRETLRGTPTQLLEAIGRFSLLASFALYALVLTGIVRTLGQIPSWSALGGTAYGRWLMLKLGLAGLALVVAALNRLLLHRSRSLSSENKAHVVWRLRRLLPLEGALAVAVLFAAGVVGQLPPPQRAAPPAESTESFIELREAEDYRVHLEVSPARAGRNELRVHLYRPDGTAVEGIERVQLSMSAGPNSEGGAVLEALTQGNGLYVASDVMFGLVSVWRIQVDVQREGRDDQRLTYDVPIVRETEPLSERSPFASPAPQLTPDVLLAILTGLGGLGVILLAQRFPAGARATPRLIGALGLAAAVVLIAMSLDSLTQTTRVASAESVARGEALYAQNCAGCHGPDGRGDGPDGREMDPPPADLPFHLPQHGDAGIESMIKNGIPAYGMPAWGDRLSEDQVADLMDFLRSEFDRGPEADPPAVSGRPRK